MKLEYLSQPDVQLGRILSSLMDERPAVHRVVVISAFARLQSVLRMKHQLAALVKAGTSVKFVLGIDLGGTSREVLGELLKWDVDLLIVKNRVPGHTFHPKLYVFEWKARSEMFICSNNLTDGGLFRNYEVAARVTYDFPHDDVQYRAALTQLDRFLNPTGATARKLTPKLLASLIRSGDVPSEAEARRNTEPSVRGRGTHKSSKAFGREDIEPPPPLPKDMLEGLLRDLRKSRKGRVGRTAGTQGQKRIRPKEVLAPAAFYMTLPTLQGPNIPGEARIPLEAIQLAEEFWGWREEYERQTTRKGKARRVYWNWRPTWRIVNADTNQATDQVVRMYLYENSSDFRFYARPLVNAGGDLGDIVRIRRLAQKDAEFECVLARKGSSAYDTWEKYCTQHVKNSDRRFGYA